MLRPCRVKVLLLLLQYLLCVCVPVCLSVCYRFVSGCNQRHLHYHRLFLDLSSWIFENSSSYGVQYANKLGRPAGRFRALSGQPKHRDHVQDNLFVESCFRRKVLVQSPRNKRDIYSGILIPYIHRPVELQAHNIYQTHVWNNRHAPLSQSIHLHR